MSKEHLTYFKVENFKKFDNLELTDIGQFNLIVGDNNVGKTSLLEAVSIVSGTTSEETHLRHNLIFNLIYSLTRRGITVKDNDSFFKFVSNRPEKGIVLQFQINKKSHYATFKKNSSSDRIKCIYDGWSEGNKKGDEITRSFTAENISNKSLIPLNLEINGNLPKEYYDTLQGSIQNKKLIIKNLQSIDNHIIEIEVQPILGNQHVMLGFDNSDSFMPITGLGESTVRVFYYLLHILQRRGQRLLIDEIDTGIHYLRMKHFLKNIIHLSNKNDVQLFMTTHSKECQEAFVALFEDEDMIEYKEKFRQFTLIEKPDGQIGAIPYSWESLQWAIKTDNETRG